ncbi:hypothetical protein D3C76_1696840 [compost metagenome]
MRFVDLLDQYLYSLGIKRIQIAFGVGLPAVNRLQQDKNPPVSFRDVPVQHTVFFKSADID